MAAEPLTKASAARHHRAVQRAERALRDLDADGAAVSFQSVARRAGVSRQWLYTQPALRSEIEQLRDRAPARAGGIPARQRAARRRCVSEWNRCVPRTGACARRTPAPRPSSRSSTAPIVPTQDLLPSHAQRSRRDVAAVRAASNGARSNTNRLRMILPSLTVTHSAPADRHGLGVIHHEGDIVTLDRVINVYLDLDPAGRALGGARSAPLRPGLPARHAHREARLLRDEPHPALAPKAGPRLRPSGRRDRAGCSRERSQPRLLSRSRTRVAG